MKTRKKHDMRQVLKNLRNALFIYAEKDNVVPPAKNAQTAYDLAKEPKELWVVPGADHVFSDPADRARVIQRTVGWLSGAAPSRNSLL